MPFGTSKANPKRWPAGVSAAPPAARLDATAQARYKKASRPLREWQLLLRWGAKDDYEAWQRRELEVPGQTWPRATWNVFYGELTPEQRAVVRLRLRGRSGRETARRLGCDEKMVRKHLQRAEVMLWFALWVTDAPSEAYEAAARRRAKSLGSALHLELVEDSRGRDADGDDVGVAPFLSPLFAGIREQGVMT